jgi:hypothetical protein
LKRYVRWDEELSEHLEPITAMATINPGLNRNHKSLVFIAQQNEGPLPHIHVKFQNSSGKTVQSHISLTSAEYSKHHKNGVKMPKDIKEEFLKVMNTVWIKHTVPQKVYDSKDKFTGQYQPVPATGYEAAVDIWIDTWELDEEKGKAKFQWDEVTGKVIMPDYTLL